MTTYHPGDTFRRIHAGVATSRRSNHALDGRIHTVDRLQSGSNTDVIDTDGTAHWGSNIELVERASAIAPATVEQVQEIVARANEQVPEFQVGDRVRRTGRNRAGTYGSTGSEFEVSEVHASTMTGPTDCAIAPDGTHHTFNNLEAATVDTTVTTPAAPLTVPAGWATMETWEQELLNPFQVGDIVQRVPHSGSSGVDFTIREIGPDGRHLSARMTTTGDEWHHLINLVLQRRPEPATVVTNTPTTTEGNIVTNSTISAPYEPQAGDIVTITSLTDGPKYRLLRPQSGQGSRAQWVIMRLNEDGTDDYDTWHYGDDFTKVTGHTPEEIEAGFYPGDVVTYARTEYTVDRVERWQDYGDNSILRMWFTTGSWLRVDQATLLRRGHNAPADATAPAFVRSPGSHGFAVGDTVRTRGQYVLSDTMGKRADQTPWVVASLDSDQWPVDDTGNYYNPSHMEIVTEAGATPEPAEEARIEINDPRIAWFWTAAAEAAREEGFCNEYERLARRLGVPGRLQKFRISAEMRGALAGVLSLEVEAEDARAARSQMIDALGGRTTAEKFRITVNSL